VAAQHGDVPTVGDVVLAEVGADGAILGTKVDAIAVGERSATCTPTRSCGEMRG
jgi:hypothetical protein